DFLRRAEYHRLPIYQEFFRPAGVEHQISIALPSTGARLVRVTLNRARGDFSERDRRVLDLVRPHVAQAAENGDALARLGVERRDLERAMEAVDVGVVVVRGGRASYMNRRARMALAASFLAAGERVCSPPRTSRVPGRAPTCHMRCATGSSRSGFSMRAASCRGLAPRCSS